VTERKKLDDKWVAKDRDDFIVEFRALEAAAAQSLTSCSIAGQSPEVSTARMAISPCLRQLHRELSGNSDDCCDEGVSRVLPEVVESTQSIYTGDAKRPGSASPATNYDAQALDNMSKTELRKLVSQTPGVSRNKRTPAGKWIPKTKEELIADFLALSASTQPLAGGRTAADKKKLRQERDRTRQREEKVKARTRDRQRSVQFRFAQGSYRKQEKYKAQKKLYEQAPRAKASRLLRRRARFWKQCLANWPKMRESSISRAASATASCALRFHSEGRLSILQHSLQKMLPCPDEPPLPACTLEPPLTEWEKHYNPARVRDGVVLAWVPFWVDVSKPSKMMVEVLGEAPYPWSSEQGKPSGFCPRYDAPCAKQKPRKTRGKIQTTHVEVAPKADEQRYVFQVEPVSFESGGEVHFQRHVQRTMYNVSEDDSEIPEECLTRLQAFFGTSAKVSEVRDGACLSPPYRCSATERTNVLRDLDLGAWSDKEFESGADRLFFTF